MTKDQKYKMLFENWKKFYNSETLSEAEGEEEPEQSPEQKAQTSKNYKEDPDPVATKKQKQLAFDKATGRNTVGMQAAASTIIGLSVAAGAAKGIKDMFGDSTAAGAAAGAAGGSILSRIKKMGFKTAAKKAAGFIGKRLIPGVGVVWTLYELYEIYQESQGKKPSKEEFNKIKNDPDFQKFKKEMDKISPPKRKPKQKPGQPGAPAGPVSTQNQDLGDPREKEGFQKHKVGKSSHYFLGPPKKLTIYQIYNLARDAGFSKEQAKIMTMIAMVESGEGYSNIHSHPGLRGGDASYGLWQINMLGKLGPARRKRFGIKSNNELLDPKKNAEAAFKVASATGKISFRPWTTYSSKKYLNYKEKVESAVSLGNMGVANQPAR